MNQPDLPQLATVQNLPGLFPHAGLTPSAVRNQIFKAEDRISAGGAVIPGNGLAEAGAIIRQGRKVLIDVRKYAQWLTGQSQGGRDNG